MTPDAPSESNGRALAHSERRGQSVRARVSCSTRSSPNSAIMRNSSAAARPRRKRIAKAHSTRVLMDMVLPRHRRHRGHQADPRALARPSRPHCDQSGVSGRRAMTRAAGALPPGANCLSGQSLLSPRAASETALLEATRRRGSRDLMIAAFEFAAIDEKTRGDEITGTPARMMDRCKACIHAGRNCWRNAPDIVRTRCPKPAILPP